jgi:hypothetical protein
MRKALESLDFETTAIVHGTDYERTGAIESAKVIHETKELNPFGSRVLE